MGVDKEEYIRYRISRSEEALDEAQIMAENKHWNTAINRLYYSCYYIVDALLRKNDIKHKTHAGTRNQFHLYFGKTGLVDRELLQYYANIFQDRQESDYGEIVHYTQEDVDYLMPKAQSFHLAIKRLILE
ncbi:uncharacterized protein (UPF0332 family) [Catalinimonas alkaloidigena]|uniref:HEPN domain-containing protein n=1 Tax=Catalinimonas alkaloidigena TaxID=1075417 RepID=UPI002405C3A4|nr:HEPN domain-containing protein [Catalinimonas alkaloidigena]MDF9796283.1 uncharacterized protein (UPF0332 family) [Catalinimonas alkaloidigena]